MWIDPLDELINDLEQVLPPEESSHGGGYAAFDEVQAAAEVILRRADQVYPDPIDPKDPELREAVQKGVQAMNRFVGRPEDGKRTNRINVLTNGNTRVDRPSDSA